ncbi:MAG: hypothetical protein GY708_02620 [Actinomycetia bacterium]|nr:hypothetical protein [Actinomycetes bacterium]MCP4958298.1 hypothetical protein [Actinomycetes bacterium]
MTVVHAVRPKPLLRGVFHKWSFIASILVGVALVVGPASDEWPSAVIYAACVATMFGASALYHRIDWSPKTEPRMMQVDKTAIYMMIAGTFTPVAVAGLDGPGATWLLIVVWSLSAILIAGLWIPWEPPYGTITTTYVALGLVAALSMPTIWRDVGPELALLLLIGGVLYFVGGILLAVRQPDPWPRVFGYHEVWHVVVIVAATIHYVGIALYVY